MRNWLRISVVAFLASQGARAEVKEITAYAFAYPPVAASEELEDEDVYLEAVRGEADIAAMQECFRLGGDPVRLSSWELLFPGIYTSRGCHLSRTWGTPRHQCWAKATRECRFPESSSPPPSSSMSLNPYLGGEGASAVNPYEGAGGASAGD